MARMASVSGKKLKKLRFATRAHPTHAGHPLTTANSSQFRLLGVERAARIYMDEWSFI
jgi:hypothetical protein